MNVFMDGRPWAAGKIFSTQVLCLPFWYDSTMPVCIYAKEWLEAFQGYWPPRLRKKKTTIILFRFPKKKRATPDTFKWYKKKVGHVKGIMSRASLVFLPLLVVHFNHGLLCITQQIIIMNMCECNAPLRLWLNGISICFFFFRGAAFLVCGCFSLNLLLLLLNVKYEYVVYVSRWGAYGFFYLFFFLLLVYLRSGMWNFDIDTVNVSNCIINIIALFLSVSFRFPQQQKMK